MGFSHHQHQVSTCISSWITCLPVDLLGTGFSQPSTKINNYSETICGYEECWLCRISRSPTGTPLYCFLPYSPIRIVNTICYSVWQLFYVTFTKDRSIRHSNYGLSVWKLPSHRWLAFIGPFPTEELVNTWTVCQPEAETSNSPFCSIRKFGLVLSEAFPYLLIQTRFIKRLNEAVHYVLIMLWPIQFL